MSTIIGMDFLTFRMRCNARPRGPKTLYNYLTGESSIREGRPTVVQVMMRAERNGTLVELATYGGDVSHRIVYVVSGGHWADREFLYIGTEAHRAKAIAREYTERHCGIKNVDVAIEIWVDGAFNNSEGWGLQHGHKEKILSGIGAVGPVAASTQVK